jgi:hypothetical protein
MDSLAFPIKFDSTGIKKHRDGTIDYYSQLLSICMLTEPGTHPMTPQFGAFDPVFQEVDKNVFVLNAAQFVPEITITNINTTGIEQSSGLAKIAVAFEITD